MKKVLIIFLFFWSLAVAAGQGPSSRAAPASMPAPACVAEMVGVNIHFTTPRPGEMEMLAAVGMRWVRMDLTWSETEKARGVYDFSAYDGLLAALDRCGLRAMLILDYGNPLYGGGLAPARDEARDAFARWAAAAAKHFAGRGVLWEIYNEPNIDQFWKPRADVKAYARLAASAAGAIRAAAPGEVVIGPATSTIDLPFLEACFDAGLLDSFSAVTVHPYRSQPPESAAGEYAALARMIAARGSAAPVLSGEWGYACNTGGVSAERQGKLLARQWLANIALDVPLSIWYDWRDDGNNPADAEHNLGMVSHAYHAGRSPVYDAKPACEAARTLLASVGRMRFSKRLDVGSGDDFVLLFTDGNDVRVAAWTAGEEHTVVLPVSPGRFDVADHLGRPQPPLAAQAVGLVIPLTDAPKYITPQSPNDLLRLAAAWQKAPARLFMPARRGAQLPLTLTNPLSRPVKVTVAPGKTQDVQGGETITLPRPFDLLRNEEPIRIRTQLVVEGAAPLVQETLAAATNPLRLWPFPRAGGAVAVVIENPGGEKFDGQLRLTDVDDAPHVAVTIAAGQTQTIVSVPEDRSISIFGLELRDAAGQPQATLPMSAFTFVDNFDCDTNETLAKRWQAVVADAKSPAPSLSFAAPPQGPPAPHAKCLRIGYDLPTGGFVRLAPLVDSLKEIDGKPARLTLWIFGDGSGLSPRLRVVDATGQTHQPQGPNITWQGWRRVTIPLDGRSGGHWGGANDGVIHHPIRWNTLLLLDAMGKKAKGEIFVACPTLSGIRDQGSGFGE